MTRVNKKTATKKAGRSAALALMAVNLKLEKGEKWRGIALDAKGQASHHVILLPGRFKGTGDHAAILAWAASIGGDVPDCIDGALLYAANADGAIEKGAYWLKDQFAGSPEGAWGQYFFTGNQGGWHKSFELRGVAVRRVPIR